MNGGLPRTFALGGQAAPFFVGMGVLSFLLFLMFVTGKEPDWVASVGSAFGALVMIRVGLWMKGELHVTAEGLRATRRWGKTAVLGWHEIESVDARAGGGGPLVASAADNWHVTLRGTHQGQPTIIAVAGSSIANQAQARALLVEQLGSRGLLGG